MKLQNKDLRMWSKMTWGDMGASSRNIGRLNQWTIYRKLLATFYSKKKKQIESHLYFIHAFFYWNVFLASYI